MEEDLEKIEVVNYQGFSKGRVTKGKKEVLFLKRSVYMNV